MQETGRQSAGNAPQATKTRPWSGLSARLLWLTFVFVTLAEILIFLPSIANMRLNWLSDRLNTAAAASVVVDGLKDVVLPKPVRDHTLMATDTKAIVLTKDGMRHLIAMADMPPTGIINTISTMSHCRAPSMTRSTNCSSAAIASSASSVRSTRPA